MRFALIKRITRFLQLTYYTIVMYFITHTIVFMLFPIWFILTFFRPKVICLLKPRFCWLLLKIVNKEVKISGLNNIEEGKNYLVISNYPSFHTGFMLMRLFPKAYIVAHSFMSKVPIISHMLQRNGFIYAHHKGFCKTKRAMNEIVYRSNDSSIIILPEGKRTHDGNIQEFKRGFLYILRHSSLDLLPITLNGFYKLKPVNRFYMEPDTELEIIIHKPINRATIQTLNDEQLATVIRNTIEGLYKQ